MPSNPSAFLVANPIFPGWKARVNGLKVSIADAPCSPIEIRLPAGRHRVELSYSPASFWLGIAVAAASLAALLLPGRVAATA